MLVKQRTAGTITSEDEAELDRLTKQELPIMRERLGEVLVKIMDHSTEKTSVGISSAD